MDKRYLQFSTYLKERYGVKTWKIPVDAGFTCPNRDGTLGYDGCIYCDNMAFSSLDRRPVLEQIQGHMRRLKASRKVSKFIIYFQSFTNTYAPLEQLKVLWDSVAALDNVVGFAVGTRPDCVDDRVLDLLASYTPELDVWLELGIQSIHDASLRFLQRGHTFAQGRDAIERAAHRALLVSVHLILGLPGETEDQMRQTMNLTASLPISGVKFHPLQILKGTALARMYVDGRVALLPRERYLQLICDAIERMPPHVVFQRLTAEAYRKRLIAPVWGIEKMAALNEIDHILQQRESIQGCRYRQALKEALPMH